MKHLALPVLSIGKKKKKAILGIRASPCCQSPVGKSVGNSDFPEDLDLSKLITGSPSQALVVNLL